MSTKPSDDLPHPDREPKPPSVFHHGDREKPFTEPAGESHLEEITAHVERCCGPVRRVMHEMISDLVHIDVLIADVAENHPYITLVTSGMSDLPLKAKDGALVRCELMIRVMANHELSKEAFEDEANYWPIRRLKMLARMPHELDTFFAAGHTIATDPPTPVHPKSEFCALGLLEPLDEAVRTLRTKDGLDIAFLQVVPLYREELEWKLKQPTLGALAELFDKESFRTAYDGRPKLRGADWDATVDQLGARMQRGRRMLVWIGVAIATLSIADFVVSLIWGPKPAYSHAGLGLWLAISVGEGSRIARWLAIVLAVAAVGFGGFVFYRPGAIEPRLVGLLVSMPLQLAIAGLLAFHPDIRLWLRHKPKRAKKEARK